MYCKYCGKMIEDDSIFCRYCGKDLSSESPNTTSNHEVRLYSRFTELSSKYQVSIIVYIIWFLGWLGFLIGNSNNRRFVEDYFLSFFLCTILFPFVGICGLYLYKMKRKQKEETTTQNMANSPHHSYSSNIFNNDIESIGDKELDAGDSAQVSPKVIKSDSLITFSRSNGKMQIVEKKSENNDIIERYCLFTNDDKTTKHVDFSEATKDLNAKDISEQKNQLCVDHLLDGSYVLNYVNDKQLEDILPF